MAGERVWVSTSAKHGGAVVGVHVDEALARKSWKFSYHKKEGSLIEFAPIEGDYQALEVALYWKEGEEEKKEVVGYLCSHLLYTDVEHL
jgi:hypothetical protein